MRELTPATRLQSPASLLLPPASRMLLLLAVLFTNAIGSAQVQRGFNVSGESFVGQLTAVNSNQGVFRFGGRSVARNDLVCWGRLTSCYGASVWLDDGSIIAAETLKIESDWLEIESRYWVTARIRRDQPLAIRFSSRSVISRIDIHSVLRAGPKSDRIVLASGDELRGRVLKYEGERLSVLPNGAAKQLVIPMSRLGLVILSSPKRLNLATTDRRSLEIGMSDGSRLLARSLEVDRKDQTLSCVLLNSDRLKWDLGVRSLERSVVAIRSYNRQVVYLSDIQPLAYKHVPFLTKAWKYQPDRNALKGELAVNGGWISKGLGTYSRSRLVFNIPADAKRFEASVSLDLAAHKLGNVDVKVYLNRPESDKPSWQEVVSQRISGDEQFDIRQALSGATQIALITDFGAGGDVMDLANWLNARFVK